MFPCPGFGYGYWWTIPLLMIGMMALCGFMMRRRGGFPRCGPERGQAGVLRGHIRRALRRHSVHVLAGLIFLALMPAVSAGAAPDIPPAAVKKTVELDQKHREKQQAFRASCKACHRMPDPLRQASVDARCAHGVPKEQLDGVRTYLEDVRAGKTLYESRCGRCHSLIDPASHSSEYWSKNVCTSEECFIEKLRVDEEQQVLLYLSSQAKQRQEDAR